MSLRPPQSRFDTTRPGKHLLIVRTLAIITVLAWFRYVNWLITPEYVRDVTAFTLLVCAEIYFGVLNLGYVVTIWHQPTNPGPASEPSLTDRPPSVDVFVTVCGEPISIVEKTVAAASALDYPNYRVYVLDDGGSSQVRSVALSQGADYIARNSRDGAKAGNLNNAQKITSGDLIAVFDADHHPDKAFLKETIPYFGDKKLAFVQTPQHYRNEASSEVAAGALEQQAIFYSAICRGKSAVNAIFSCGTNVVYRRSALESVGGFPEDSVTEDLALSFNLHRHGWRSIYLPKVLAQGLGPETIGAYLKQQNRWARGGLDLLLSGQWLTRPGLTAAQRFQYFLPGYFWFNSVAFLLYLSLPALHLFFAVSPFTDRQGHLWFFIPYFLSVLILLAYSTGSRMTYRAIYFTLNSFPANIAAIFSALFKRRSSFFVTPKKKTGEDWVVSVFFHLIYVILLTGGIMVGLLNGFDKITLNNVAFAGGHIFTVSCFVRIARISAKTRDDSDLVPLLDLKPQDQTVKSA